MRVRYIFWYRKEEERFINFFPLQLLPWAPQHWESFGFLDNFGGILTREQFEKDYLEWKAQNEG